MPGPRKGTTHLKCHNTSDFAPKLNSLLMRELRINCKFMGKYCEKNFDILN